MNGAMGFLFGFGLRNIRPAIYGWIVNVFFSLAVYFGFYKLFLLAAGKSVWARDIVPGEKGIFTFFGDIVQNYPGSVPLLFFMCLIAVILFYLISIFVSGGIFSVFVEDERTSFINLLASSIENYFAMLVIFLGNILVWLIMLIFPALLTYLYFQLLPSMSNGVSDTIFYVLIALWILFFSFGTAIYDYVRIFKMKEEKGIWEAFKKGIGFVFSNKWNIFVIILLYGLSLLLVFLVYYVTRKPVSFLYASLIFIVYQFFMLLRYFLKIVMIRGEIFLTVPKEE